MLNWLLRYSWRVAVTTFSLVGPTFAFYASLGPDAADCGEIGDGYGPFDYRTAPAIERRLVEGAHFTPEVEALIRGHRSGTPAGDIDYTLRAFPNHHRALLSMMNAGFKLKTDKPPGSRYTIQCWFERGIAWTPDDGKVYMLFGIYLLRRGDARRAVTMLEKAQTLATDDANLYYNMGLAYFSLKNYDKALTNAHEAYRLGFPLPGLRDMLKRAGKWQDAPPAPVAGSATPEAATTEAPAAAAAAAPLDSGTVVK